MSEKLIKVWNTKLRKAVVASSFEELISEGSKKLNIKNEKFSAFFEDGTEIDDEEVYQALPAGLIIYMLTDKDKKPWDGVLHANDVINTNKYSSFSSSSSKQADIPLQEAPSPWPCSFTVPTSSFSKSLQRDVQSGELSWATKSELLGIICDEIIKYTFFPTVNQRDIVARQLIKQFPNLKSNIGEFHEGWSSKIYDRMKNYLKKTDAFSYKRKVDSENAMLKYSSRLKKSRIIPTEEHKMVEDAKRLMKIEMKKVPSKRDMATIEVGLKVSSCHRKELIESNIPLGDLKYEYPALFTVFGIGYDFNIASKIDLKKTILTSLHACSSDILKYAEKKRKDDLLILIKEVDSHVNELLVTTVMIIPEILGENPDFIYKINSEESKWHEWIQMPITPHLVVIGDPFFSTEFYVVAENKILVECCEFLEGIATLIGLYFVANIEYPTQAAATYKFFQSYILRLPCSKLPGKLITFCKSLPMLDNKVIF